MTIVIGGNLVRSDLIVSEVLRTDMSPIPVTLEATLRVDKSTRVAQGDIIQSGKDNLDFNVIHVTDNNNIQMVQGGRPYAVISLIATLNAVTPISFQRKTAVVRTAASLGEIYKACGAAVRVDSDFTPVTFACFIGSVPTFAIAQLLQEEGGVVFWTDGKIKFLRLPDLMKQAPAKTMLTDSTVNIESGFLERHEIPLFYSTDDMGSVIQGTPDKTRVAQYMPRQDVRTLTNMTRVLVMKKEFKSPYAPDLNAGQIFTIVDTPYAVVTAAHVVQTGTDGSGTNAYSKFWLGALQ